MVDLTPFLVLVIQYVFSACLHYMLMNLFTTSQIGPLHGSQGSKKRVKVRVQLNLHGIFSIESATVSKKASFYHSILCYEL